MRHCRLFACLFILCLVLSGCALREPDSASPIGVRMPVTTEPAALGTITIASRVTARIEPIADATVSAKVPGRIREMRVGLGDRVSVDDHLVSLDDEDVGHQVAQAEAAVSAARASLSLAESGARPHELEMLRQQVAQVRASRDSAEANRDRVQRLYAEGGVAEQQVEAAELQAVVADAQHRAAVEQLEAAESGAPEQNLELLRAQVRQAEAMLAAARSQREATGIRSPLAGVVAAVYGKAGELTGVGTPLVQLVDIDRVVLVAGMPETLVNRVRPGDIVTVEVPAVETRALAEVTAVGPTPDPRTRTYPVRLELPNPGHSLKPGMYASVSIIADQRQDVVIVPRHAVLDIDGGHCLFVVHDGAAKLLRVVLGLVDGDRAEIVHGVAQGDPVITSGHHYLVDGQPVTVVGGTAP